MSIWWRMGKSGQVVWLRGRDARAEWPSQITEREEIEILERINQSGNTDTERERAYVRMLNVVISK